VLQSSWLPVANYAIRHSYITHYFALHSENSLAMCLPSHFIYIKSFAIWHLDIWKALVTSIFSYAPLQFNIQVTVMLPEAIPNLQDISWKFLQLVQFELMSQYNN
jgi:hypothetical protein